MSNISKSSVRIKSACTANGRLLMPGETVRLDVVSQADLLRDGKAEYTVPITARVGGGRVTDSKGRTLNSGETGLESEERAVALYNQGLVAIPNRDRLGSDWQTKLVDPQPDPPSPSEPYRRPHPFDVCKGEPRVTVKALKDSVSVGNRVMMEGETKANVPESLACVGIADGRVALVETDKEKLSNRGRTYLRALRSWDQRKRANPFELGNLKPVY